MAIEFHLQRTDKSSWGFRLTGGVEYDVPLTVIKVGEGSIAENVGMEVGDHVVRVNDICMSNLTHVQAHDVLQAAGNDFVIAVRRGDLSNLPPKLISYETSVENGVDTVTTEARNLVGPEEDNNLNITDEEIVNIIGEQVHMTTQRAAEISSSTKSVQSVEHIQSVQISEEVTAEISGQIEISATQKQQSEVTKILEESSKEEQEKKWSTFLQKPSNPKPKPKLNEADGSKAPAYRVVIKKQPKKGQEPPKEDSAVTEETTEPDIPESEESKEIIEETQEIRTEQDELYEDKNQLDENENHLSQEQGEEDEDKEEKESPPESESEIGVREKRETENEDIQEEPDINSIDRRLSINLEEQLAQVQQQLLALSQLPSAIQQTLNAVTQQLAEIVSVKQTQEQEISIEARAIVEEEITTEYLEVSEPEERPLSVLEEETSEYYEEEHKVVEEQITEVTERNESEDEQALFEMLEKEIEEEECRKQEELEVQRIEQEKNEKRDKERRPSYPQTPLQRPIILPGGRKWSQPDDAISKRKRPSMTDEKIANTINTFTEVIVGRTMGINFLKYQPPPKNLEHLQNSAVYRLVHDMEPALKGIGTRDTKILAEQDYYSEKQEEKDFPAQMSR